MYKIGVIGQRDRVLAFMAAGYVVYEAETTEDAATALKTAKNDGCAVIFITPDLAEAACVEISKYDGSVIPAVIPLPELGGGYGIARLKNAVLRAVGADIIFRD